MSNGSICHSLPYGRMQLNKTENAAAIFRDYIQQAEAQTGKSRLDLGQIESDCRNAVLRKVDLRSTKNDKDKRVF